MFPYDFRKNRRNLRRPPALHRNALVGESAGATSVLALMGLSQPAEMEGHSLLER